MAHKIGVSIINYRTGDLTINCLESVLSDLNEIDGQVVVVDNNSADGSAEQITDWLAKRPDAPVTLVQSKTNGGFSFGHNLGLRALNADYYLVLNSDAVLRRGFFSKLLAAAQANPDAGFIAPRIETDDGDVQVSRFRFHSPQSEFVRGAATGPLTSLLKRYVVALDPSVPAREVQWASFACILIKAEVLADVGLMDEGYFLYFEDCEYCLRAGRKGWRIALADNAVAVHFRGGSGPVKSLELARKRLPEYYYISRTRFFRQAYGRFGPIAANIAWTCGRGVAQLRRCFGKPVKPSMHMEMKDIWTNAADPLKPAPKPGETHV